MKSLFARIILFSILGISPFLVDAQISLVPANHPVYEWLHKQRIIGHVSNYSYETLPLSRGRVFELLREVPSDEVRRIDKKLLNAYLLEFSMDSLRAAKSNTLIQGKSDSFKNTVKMKTKLLFSRYEPHLYVYEDSSAVVNLDYVWGRGYQYSSLGDNIDYKIVKLRGYGSLYDHFGFYLEAVSASGAGPGLKNVEYWGKTYDALQRNLSSTIYAEGFVSFKYKKLSLHIGNGNIKYGTGNDETLIFRLKATNFDWVRLNFDSKYFNYTFIHGALQGLNDIVPLGNTGLNTRTSAQRWVSLRRFQLRPFKQLQIAFTETLTYSNRGVDIAYINPIYPLRIGEFNRGEQDNPTWYLDALIKPIKGLELYGTLGIDDLNEFGDILKSTGNRSNEGAVLSFQAGIHASPKGLFQANVEYERIEPFFYAHRFGLNAYTQPFTENISLANEIGPNADQWYFSIKKWLPWRGWIKGYVSTVRKGLNEYDSEGNLVLDAGGDISMGQDGGPNKDLVRFLAGDLHKYKTIGLETFIEPWRGISFYFDYNRRVVTQGDNIQDRNTFAMKINFNFYPILFAKNKLPLLKRIPNIHL